VQVPIESFCFAVTVLQLPFIVLTGLFNLFFSSFFLSLSTLLHSLRRVVLIGFFSASWDSSETGMVGSRTHRLS